MAVERKGIKGEQAIEPVAVFGITTTGRVISLQVDDQGRIITTLSGGDIQLGAIEIKDDTTDDRVHVDNVEDLITTDHGIPVANSEMWRSNLQVDENPDDSDKTFTVPAGVEWQILWVWVEYTSTATAGDRQLELQVLDDTGDVIASLARASVVQTASLTRYYLFAPAIADLLGFRDTEYLSTPIPPTTFLPPGYRIRIFDNNAIAAAADDMIVQMMIALRGV